MKGGFARHAFFSTGSSRDQLMAFWDLSNVPGNEEIRTDICRDLGLDPLTNHLAFSADDMGDLEQHKNRWLSKGYDVLEIDHNWVHSIYTEDPDGIAVEFAVLTKDFTEADSQEALELLRAKDPAPSQRPALVRTHKAAEYSG
jgi:hypothetical protein